MSAEHVTAADRLRTLDTYHRTPLRGAPTVRAAPSTLPGVPANLGMLDYLDKTKTEIIEQADRDERAARAADPHVHIPTRPAQTADMYAWMQSIPAIGQASEDAREEFIHRQALEHAIREGDIKVVRRHPCPGCGCYTLFWRPAEKRAACLNRRCTTRDGLTRMWPLADLASRHVLNQRMLKNSATS